MNQKEVNYETDYRIITIKTIDGATVRGRINVSPNQRVSDLFANQKGPFVVVIDAAYNEMTGKILLINKRHIVWVEPED